MPLRALWSMGLTEGVVQRVDMSLSTNKLACVLASIIGVPCNVPLPRAVLCVPMAVLNEGCHGFNGTPVSFKQTQGDPLLFSMLHRTAGSPWGLLTGAYNRHRRSGPEGLVPTPHYAKMTSLQELHIIVCSYCWQVCECSIFQWSDCQVRCQRWSTEVGLHVSLSCDWFFRKSPGTECLGPTKYCSQSVFSVFLSDFWFAVLVQN